MHLELELELELDLHVTESILKDCLCDINISVYYKQHKTLTANDIYSRGDCTDFLLFSVNHLTEPVTFILRIWSLEHRFYQLSIFNAHLRVPVFKYISLTFHFYFFFFCTQTHTYTVSVLSLPFSHIHRSTTLMLLKLLASYVGLRKHCYPVSQHPPYWESQLKMTN